MKGADPVGKARTVFTFNTQVEIDGIATGCDGDNGGLSTANFTTKYAAWGQPADRQARDGHVLGRHAH